MKTIGLIGGMSWESTALYYQTINREVQRRRGGLHSAPLHLISLDFADIAARQRAGDWRGMEAILCDMARRLEAGGADCVLIGTNTMHKIAPAVQAAVGIPLLHIAEVTARAIGQAGLSRVALLGTRFTMEEPFYRDILAAHGIECLIPDEDGRAEVHHVIFNELCLGRVEPRSRRSLQEVCAVMRARGAEGVILGCTELPMILGGDDVSLPLFDTTRLHALAAVDFALGG
jgi:aspartate racemase